MHKAPAVRALVEAAGCRLLLLLPPYSPDLNPIDMATSKVKALLRSMAARETEALVDAIGVALASVTPQDATDFIRHCGYYDATGAGVHTSGRREGVRGQGAVSAGVGRRVRAN